MPDSDTSVSIFIAHASESREFAATLSTLFRDVFGLGALQVRRREVETATDSVIEPEALRLASQVPVLIAVDFSGAPEPPPRLAAFLSAAEDAHLRVRLATSETPPWTGGPATVEVAGNDAAALEDLVGHVAGALGSSQTLTLLPQRGRLEALRKLAQSRLLAALTPRQRLQRWSSVVLPPLVLAIFVYVWFFSELRAGKFEFEQDTQGWRVASTGPRGCLKVNQSERQAHWGSASLELELELEPTPDQRAGEAWVDLSNSALSSGPGPMDLHGQRVTAWVYASQAAAGSEKRPNGLQLFVKDKNHAGHYGPWFNLRPEQWTQVSLVVGSQQDGSRPADSFLTNNVVLVGVKVELGGGASEGFSGEIYLDSVDW